MQKLSQISYSKMSIGFIWVLKLFSIFVCFIFLCDVDGRCLLCDLSRLGSNGCWYLAAGGDSETPVWQRIFWAGLMGVSAITLLLAGGLTALQTVTIASASFSMVLLASVYGLKALRVDVYKRDSQQLTTVAPPASRNRSLATSFKNMTLFPKRSRKTFYGWWSTLSKWYLLD